MGNKALKVLVFIGCFSFQGIAQSVPIQLMVVDSDGFEKVNHTVKLRLTLTNDTSNTTGQYQEVHLTQSNDFGMVSESLGGGVVTTNSSVYALSEFAFNVTEPMIKIELDTTALSNQYYTVGTLAYTYPLVARRALRSDSADYSSLSLDAEYADTAEYARNFDESLDNDTSSQNELQDLSYDSSSGDLTISGGNTVKIIQNNNLTGVAVLVEEIPNNADLSDWQAADSLFLYKWSGSTLSKAPLSDPTNINSINVGFDITHVSPYDSIVFGVTRSSSYQMVSIHSCKLDGATQLSKSWANDPLSVRFNGDTINFYKTTYSNYTFYDVCYNWILSTNAITTPFSFTRVNTNYQCGNPGGTIGETGRYSQYHTSTYIGGTSGSNYRCTTFVVDRFTGVEVDNSPGVLYNPMYFNSTGRKSVRRIMDYNNEILNFTLNSDLYTAVSTFSLAGPSSSYSSYDKFIGYFDMDDTKDDGQYLYPNIFSSNNFSATKEELYGIHSENINTTQPSLKLLMSNWSTHPLASGSYYIIERRNDFLLILDRVSNYVVNDALRNGSYIVHIPKN